MERLFVNSPDGTYDLLIGAGLLDTLDRYVDLKRAVIATNDTLKALYADRLEQYRVPIMTMQDGEPYKTLESVRGYYDQLIAHKADRQTILIAFGGGVVGDTAGFAGATYMRGIEVVQVPTTLLAMVDSSVGGKVGVDVPQGKNLIGAFKQPKCVIMDTDTLKTLSDEQWRVGMAEVLKHGLLADEGLLDPALHTPANAVELVTRAVQVKINVVQQDPYEQNIRAYLNLGHTFAHAIEQVTTYAWLHGDAVGIGLLLAVRLSHRLGLCDEALVRRVDSALAGVGLPRDIGQLDPESLYRAMATDKKWQGGNSRFVLLEGMNRAVVKQGVPKETIIAILEEARA